MLKCNRANILGTEYRIEFVNFESEETDGLCDPVALLIKVRNDNTNNVGDFEELQKRSLRHELIHAFMFESGLGPNWQHAEQFGHDETTVDWFAIQFPKIYDCFKLVGCI